MGGFSNLGSVYVEVGADLSSLAKELQGAVAEAGQAGQQIGQSLEQGIAQGAQPASAGLHEVGEAAHEAESSFSSLGESAGELAGLFGIGLGIEAVVEGLKELAESSVEAYGEIQLATVAMTALTGSTEVATEVIEKMKALAMSSIFSDTALINAAQKMAAIGVAAEAIPPLMKAVTDAAVGTGNGLDSVSSALDRIYLSGAVSSRTLSQLGISISDLGTTMGMAADQVKDAFTAMGPQSEAALEILRATIERKMAAAGDAVKGTLPNAINQVKVQWNDLLETIGGSAAGGLTNLLSEINQLIASFRVLGEALSSIGGVGGILSTMFPQIDAVTAVWSKFKDVNIGIAAALDVAKGKYPDFATALAALDKVVQGATASTQAGTQATLDKAKADAESKDKTDAAAAAAREAYAAHENLKNIKELLTTATSLANEAEKTLAEDMRALSIPAIKELGQAEADVAITRAALVTADGIAKSSLEALNAERAKAVPNAQVLKQLEDDLKVASTNAALARTSLKDAESALDLTRKTAKDAAAQLSQDELAHANFLKAVSVPVVMDYKTALDAVNTAKRTATEADAALTVAEESYNAALKSGDPAAVAAATNALQTARAKLKVDTDAVKTSEDNLKKSQDAVTAATKEIQTIDKALDEFYLREMIPHLVNLKESINDTVDAKKAATDAGDDLRRIELELESAILNEGDATQHVRDLTTEAAAARLDFTNKTKNLHEIEQIVANDFGITVAQLHLLQDQQTQTAGSAKTLADAYEASGIRTTAALQAEEAAANAAYKAITQDPSAGLQQKLQALQNEINAEIALGQSVPADQQIQLAKMTQQETDYINNSAKRWTDLSNSIHADVQGMFSGLITDLFTGGDFISTIEKTLQTIGEQVVSAIFKPFTDLISQTISSLITPLAKTLAGWISDALTAIFPSLAGALGAGIGATATTANTTAVTANTAAVTALTTAMSGSAAAGAAGSAGGIGDVAGSISSGLTGLVGAIGSVGTMISSIIGNFQNAEMIGKLRSIEEHTDVMAITMTGIKAPTDNISDQSQTMIGILKTIRDLTQDFSVWKDSILMLGINHINDTLKDIVSKWLEDINAVLHAMLGAPTSGNTTGSPGSFDPGTASALLAYITASNAMLATSFGEVKQKLEDAAGAIVAALRIDVKEPLFWKINEIGINIVNAIHDFSYDLRAKLDDIARPFGVISDVLNSIGGGGGLLSGVGSMGASITSGLSGSFGGILGGVLQAFGVGKSGEQDRLNIIANNTSGMTWLMGGPGGLWENTWAIHSDLFNLFTAFTTWNRDWQVSVQDMLTDAVDHIRSIDASLKQIVSNPAGLTASMTPSAMPSPEISSGFSPANLVDAFRQAIAGLRGNVFMDSKEFFSSFVQFAEDNGLVIPQS